MDIAVEYADQPQTILVGFKVDPCWAIIKPWCSRNCNGSSQQDPPAYRWTNNIKFVTSFFITRKHIQMQNIYVLTLL